MNTSDASRNSPLISAAEFGHDKCVLLLLQANAEINKRNREGHNALEKHLLSGNSRNHDIVMYLYATGETIKHIPDHQIPDAQQHEEEQIQLKHICRQAIRQHLLDLNQHLQLFKVIPLPGLPRPLTEYLLFYKSMD